MQSAVLPAVTIVLHPQESMSAATAYTSISLVVQFTRLYPHEYVYLHSDSPFLMDEINGSQNTVIRLADLVCSHAAA